MTVNEEGAPLLPPSTVLQNRYRILRLHDRGGSATVYLAERLGMEGSVPLAVKELNPSAFGLAEFKNEVNVLYTLNHPNLPKVYDFFEENGRHYLVMDFVRGVTLKQRVLEGGPIPEDQVIAYALQVADIFRYLHERTERKIIHRDVKPSNLMLTPQGQIKLLDFGIARTPQASLPGDRLYAFTEDYASPEQKANRPTDERSDIYSFGVTLYFLLTGTTPGGPSTVGPAPTGHREVAREGGREVAREVAREAAGTPAPTATRPERVRHLSREMRRIIGKCLRANPAERYQSFAELARDLEAYRRAKRTRTTRALWTAAAVVALTALGVAAKSIFAPSLYPVVGPTRVPAGASVTLEAGLPAAWSGSLDSIVWQVQDTQALEQEPTVAGHGRYLSFSSTDLGVFQVQAYLDTGGQHRPLTTVQRIEVFPALDVPSELLVGQPLTLRTSGLTAGGGRQYSFSWSVKGPVGAGAGGAGAGGGSGTGASGGAGTGAGAGAAPVVLASTTGAPVSGEFTLTQPGSYLAQVSATVKSPRGLEVTVTGDPVTVSAVTQVAVDPARVVNINGGFEDRLGAGPAGWSLVYPAHLAYDRTGAGAHGGTAGLRFSPWTREPASYAVQLVSLESGGLYRVTVWARGAGLGAGSKLTLETDFRSALDGSYVLPSETVEVPLVGDFGWRQLMLYFRVPSGVPINLEVYLKYSGSGTLWLDDCAVEKLA